MKEHGLGEHHIQCWWSNGHQLVSTSWYWTTESGSKPLGGYKQSGCEADQLFKPPIHFWISALVTMTESCSEGLLWSARRPTTNLAPVLRDASFPISLSNTALSQVCSHAAGSLQLLLHSGWVFFRTDQLFSLVSASLAFPLTLESMTESLYWSILYAESNLGSSS